MTHKKTPAATKVTTSALDSAIIAAQLDSDKALMGNKPPRRNERRKARDRKRWPDRSASCHNRVKPKGPVLNTPQITRLQPPPTSGVLSCPNWSGPRPRVLGWFLGKMGLSVRLAARRDPCVQHLAHPLPLNRWRVASESHHGALTMTTVTLARAAAPISIASRRAAPIPSTADTTNPQIIALYAAAENALASALHLLRSIDCDPAKLQAATGRAIRAATLLKRASAAQEGGAA